MSEFGEHAKKLTVRTRAGERVFLDAFALIDDKGVLHVIRRAKPVAWFADGMWVEVSFE